MCTSGLGERISQSLNPEHEFKSSLRPRKALEESLSPIVPQPPKIPEPPKLQDAKEPDMSTLRRRNRQQTPGIGTLLTGPAGVSVATGAPTLLGG